mmetsp:Transcript_14204/g.42212  ORF Transcript_14204/g.42212 Transcript_14204/m.42212 type:complete len:206 (+) Transcript_14204:505-1122(+)
MLVVRPLGDKAHLQGHVHAHRRARGRDRVAPPGRRVRRDAPGAHQDLAALDAVAGEGVHDRLPGLERPGQGEPEQHDVLGVVPAPADDMQGLRFPQKGDPTGEQVGFIEQRKDAVDWLKEQVANEETGLVVRPDPRQEPGGGVRVAAHGGPPRPVGLGLVLLVLAGLVLQIPEGAAQDVPLVSEPPHGLVARAERLEGRRGPCGT